MKTLYLLLAVAAALSLPASAASSLAEAEGNVFTTNIDIEEAKFGLLPSHHRNLQTTYYFTFVGFGMCQDSGTNYYDFVFSSVADAATCADTCSNCPGQNQAGRPLLGFTFDTVASMCLCALEDGASLSGTCPGEAGSDSSYSGTDPIAKADGNTNKECWKVADPEDPSSSPSSQPSSQPSSVLSMRPSDEPSSEPSSQPSAEPSTIPSKSPSEEPSLLPSKSSQPSSKPSGSPSKSSVPSSQPSAVPSKSTTPSSEPSLVPSKSSQPSSQPSLKPSYSTNPTSGPSLVPSISTQPSSQPSDIPSMRPSDVPSLKPSYSTNPTSEPSLVPSISTQPSSQPSDIPSMRPSGIPSMRPSDEPSSMPSSQPSSEPSSMPSDVPSLEPSPQPSDEPSSEPSSQPSSEPSSMPSDEPSSMPSDEPSSEPSSQPSESAAPSCSPSSAPTESPSKPVPGVNLFYPDWTSGNEGCRNDGDEPDYMAVSPTDWLSSTMQACCKKFFGGYLYDSCMGRYPPDHDDCNVMLYYPDWNGENVGCTDDGQEPYYMLTNAQYFLSNTREECCKKFYGWNYYECTGTKPQSSGGYYPDWTGASSSATTCLNDGKEPLYMMNSPTWYLSSTLKECCERHFHWALNDCMGTQVVGTGKWYVKYEALTCVQDCTGGSNSNCGGIAESWDEVFDSKKECCDTKMWYEDDCVRN